MTSIHATGAPVADELSDLEGEDVTIVKGDGADGGGNGAAPDES